jgi:hypothetical protein
MPRTPEEIELGFPAHLPDSAHSLSRLDQVEILETFDEAIRARFGMFISAAVLQQPTKRRRTRSAAR